MNIPHLKIDLPKAMEDRLISQLRGLGNYTKGISFIVGVLLPVVEGALVSLLTASTEKLPYLLALIVVATLHLMLVAIQFRTESPLPQFLVEFDELGETSRVLSAKVDTLELYSATMSAAVDGAKNSLMEIGHLNNETPDLSTALLRVLTPWGLNRTPIFWFFEGTALYNVAVYLEVDGRLHVAQRLHDDRLTINNRAWRPGDGLVGICFIRGENQFHTHIAGNAPDILRTTQPQPGDSASYNSYLASPLTVDGKILGVVVVTSSASNQFDEDLHIPIIDLLGRLLSQTLQYYVQEGTYEQQKITACLPSAGGAGECDTNDPVDQPT